MKKSIGIIVLLGLNFITYGTAGTISKCLEIKSGGYYDGVTSPRKDDVNSYEDCKSLCENDNICYGWQYQASSKSCWLQTSISTYYTDASYMAGACIGPDAKITCKENLPNMYYNGATASTITGVAAVEDCMKKCDAASACLGWSYSSKSTTCWLQTTVYGPVTSSQYQGGACIKKQPPYPAITIDDFRKQALQRHNMYRRKHGSGDLKLDDELNKIAQDYAQTLADKNVFEHSGNKFHGDFMGENIYMMSGLSQPLYAPGTDSVTMWYNEKDYYDFNSPRFGPTTGHFTQAVWKNTTSLGVGRGVTKDNSTIYIVANYYPGGNVQNAFANNVLKPT